MIHGLQDHLKTLHQAPGTKPRFNLVALFAAWRRRARIRKLQHQVNVLSEEHRRLLRAAMASDLMTGDVIDELQGLYARRLMLEGELRRELGN